MQKGFLKFAAALLGTGLVVVPFMGLDSLPRDVRRQIVAERTAFSQAQRDLRTAQDQVAQDLQAEAELFRSVPASREWPAKLEGAASELQSAARDMEQLGALEKANRRQDRDRTVALLAKEKAARTAALSRAAAIRKDADHWVELKKTLPDQLKQSERDRQALQAFDFGPVSAAVEKAKTDWPDKRTDLEARLGTLRQTIAEDDSLWQSTAAARSQAAAGNLAGLDLGALLVAIERIHNDAAGLPQKGAEIQSLTAQLNRAWDKVLVDMETRGSGGDKTYQQKVRTVTVPKDGQASSDEKWVQVPQSRFDSMKNDLGMAVEHKALGKYDSEAERVSQPAGFAYMASPGQGRNQYGYWENRGGQSFWVWYGQYALLRDLLFNNQYRPLDRGQYEDFRSYQSRGQTYYGRDYGTQGQATKERYSGSSYARSGGFKDSKYASKPGGYRDSEYATPSGSSTPRQFGNRQSQQPSSNFRTAPSRPSPRPSSSRPSSSGSGRRFGRR
jgi:hypothetical protein